MPSRTDQEETRGERVCRFIRERVRIPDGVHLGEGMDLLDFQEEFILAIYDNPAGTSRAYLSLARKNGKSALIAAIILAHLVGPEARQNTQIISGARSRDQAAVIFNLAAKMVALSPELRRLVKIKPSTKTMIGLPCGVEYRAISAEASTAHGLSPVVAVLDEVGQVKGPQDAFIEAIETAQGAHASPLLIAISTQASEDADLFSMWLDDAGADPHTVCRTYTAPEGCDLMDKAAWRAANPAMGEFRSVRDIAEFAERARRLPSSENTFRWLFLNQRVQAKSRFLSKSRWEACSAPAAPIDGVPVWGGLDLSATTDLTALVLAGRRDGKWHVHPTFWVPADGIVERSKRDRVPYDVWQRQGHLIAAPGRSVDYEFVAAHLREVFDRYKVQKIAFDRWNFKHLRPWLLAVGFSEKQLEDHFVEFGQGYQSMSPALADLEREVVNERLAHGGHPVLDRCAANAVAVLDPSGNRKLAKDRSTGRIDGMVALAMAIGAATSVAAPEPQYQFLVV